MNESIPNPTVSLADLATSVRTKAEQYSRSLKGENATKLLQQRLDQIEPLVDVAARLAQARKLVATADPKVRFARKQLGPKLTKLEKLEAAAALDVGAVLVPNAFDVTGWKEAFAEAEGGLLENWQKVARPKAAASGAAALADVPELAGTVKQIYSTRQALEADAKNLPKTTAKVAEVLELQKQLAALSETLRTHGCDEEVLAFLAQARTGSGIALTEALKNPKLSAWLAAGRNADALRIVHKSALNTASAVF